MSARLDLSQLRPGEPLWVDGFLTTRTCQRLVEELDYAFWQPSTVVRQGAAGAVSAVRSRVRTSESTAETWFSPSLRRAVRHIEARLAKGLNCAPERFEPWQATRYRPRGQFDYHLDGGHWGTAPGGERQTTVLLYLDTPERGGGTHFKHLDVLIQAQVGRLVVWRNLLADGTCDERLLHAGLPLIRGHKTTLVTWVRQRALRGPHLDM